MDFICDCHLYIVHSICYFQLVFLTQTNNISLIFDRVKAENLLSENMRVEHSASYFIRTSVNINLLYFLVVLFFKEKIINCERTFSIINSINSQNTE